MAVVAAAEEEPVVEEVESLVVVAAAAAAEESLAATYPPSQLQLHTNELQFTPRPNLLFSDKAFRAPSSLGAVVDGVDQVLQVGLVGDGLVLGLHACRG